MRDFYRSIYKSCTGKAELCCLALLLLLLLLLSIMPPLEAKTIQNIQTTTGINLIQFDQNGWEVKKKTAEEVLLEKGSCQIHVLFFDKPAPDLKDQIENQKLHKQIQKTLAEKNIGLMSFEICYVKGVSCLVIHTKEVQESPSATRYTSSVQLPVKGQSCIITVTAREANPTGRRSALVLTRLMNAGEVTFNRKTAELDNWYADPYDSSLAGPLVRNKSELEIYDDIFPDHALTLVRKTVHNILTSLKVDKQLVAMDTDTK